MDNNIVNALSQVAPLVEATKQMQEVCEQQTKTLAELARRNAKAEIPDTEVKKVTTAVETKVKTTPCALPDTDDIAEQVSAGILNRVQSSIQTAVEDKIKSTPITLEHHHTHATTWEMSQFAEEATKKWQIVLVGICFILILWVAGGSYWYFHSELFWAKEYVKVRQSEYATEAEKQLLWENATVVGVLPKEYYTSPSYTKAKIRQNQAVLAERRKEAKANKGRYSTKVPIER